MNSKALKPETRIESSGVVLSGPITTQQADYETWCRADLWTIERAILLLLNAETLPVKDYFSGRCKTRNEQVIYDDFMKIWAIAKSSLKTGVLTKIDKGYPELYSEVLPGDFIAWARSKDYSIPAKVTRKKYPPPIFLQNTF